MGRGWSVAPSDRSWDIEVRAMHMLNQLGRSCGARRLSTLVGMAATAVLSAAPWAGAQARVGSDGHANDANNRMGSGGVNTPADGSGRTNTQLNPGAATGLARFHGLYDTFDPNVTQANSNDRAVQDFLSRSATPAYTGPTTGVPNYAPYYDPQTHVGSPSSLAPTAPVGQTPDVNDTRLTAVGGTARSPIDAGPATGGRTVADATGAAQSHVDASSLFGVRAVQADEPSTTARAPVAPPTASPIDPVVPPATQSAQLAALEQRFASGRPAVGGDRPDAPFLISSLAVGTKDGALAKLLRDAEGQMRSGAFGRSVETYDAAASVAPNNPFVPLGRGFAELGAGYYGRGEADLTRAILSEPALLAARYDLAGFLGADRLKFVQGELTDIAATEQTARPHLLLAFIAHNAGADDLTAKDLAIAADRGSNPKLVALMREAWDVKR